MRTQADLARFYGWQQWENRKVWCPRCNHEMFVHGNVIRCSYCEAYASEDSLGWVINYRLLNNWYQAELDW